ncbi:MAG: hypothetical protein KJ614_11155 [Gammaproteobacteria bacterium]|uniref:hypothetical protein n=1 Tax=Rhodoferax sp. TaxID=50421 RepID=UPI0017ABC13D|nr:hypothetical protein [Rhodoferax sp.]MBU3899467.1 hypothetical protein [Gammaproteobacteria bacterium]MBA3059537.1 hypothetical protein [Rhodoferax sp.]MBU3998720.1 hypothetical protein [Gammaproteobacteria bacterium]MBU4017943.1 hypothetical protein [Gammaproteobacteria bacterium]MBU4080367.1 hypothetical protein [Gammaproteobacteria bacterium]
MINIQATNFKGLIATIEGKSRAAALPSNLLDPYLHQIGRDLRIAELYLRGDYTKEPYISGILYLIAHLMRERMRENGHEVTKLKVNEDLFHVLMKIYQRYIEREIVARVVGGRCEEDGDEMLCALDLQIASFSENEHFVSS